MKPQSTFAWPVIRTPWQRCSREFKLAFISACIIGLIVHLYIFTNLLLGGDAVTNTYSDVDHTVRGRWALKFFCAPSSIYQMPVIIGLISIVFLALAAAFTVRVLELSHPFSIVLTAGLLVSFPAVANTLTYLFLADAYFIALAMSALAVYLAKYYRYGFIGSIVLLAVSCGIYQAYIPYVLTLCLFDCIVALLTKSPVKSILTRGGIYILTVLGGLVLYLLLTKLSLKLIGGSLTAAQGLNTMDSVSISSLFSQIPRAYKHTYSMFKGWPFPYAYFQIAQKALPVLLAAASVFLCVIHKLYKEPLRLLLLAAGILLSPLALGSMVIFAYAAEVHRLMIFSFVLPYFLMIKLAEVSAQELVLLQKPYWKGILAVSVLCSTMLFWNNFLLTNIGYHALQITYENSTSLATRIVDRIETTEGYTAGGPVAFVGAINLSNYTQSKEHYWQYYNAIGEMIRYSAISSREFMQQYSALQSPELLTAEQMKMLQESEEVAAMPGFPAKGSVIMVDGIIVVKLGEGNSIS